MSLDPLARERFRSTIFDLTIDCETLDCEFANRTLDAFPEVHFEYRQSELGVPLRRVVAAGEWETDPAAYRQASSGGPA